MDGKISRRKFLRNTTFAAAAVSAGMSRGAHAVAETKKVSAADKITLGIIGTGGRGCHLMRTGINKIPDVTVAAICDMYEPHLVRGKEYAGEQAKMYHDYRKLLEQKDLDAVLVTTPLDRHATMSIEALQAGKHVFCEKTMAYTIEEGQDMVRAVRDTGKVLQVGHQRHYDPSYIHAVKLAQQDGVLGRINHIRCQWHRNGDWRRHIPEKDPGGRITIPLERWLNWRLYNEYSGGLMTELGSHQVDVATWILDAMPTAVTAMGGIDYWKDGRDIFDNIQVVYEYVIDKSSAAYFVPEPRNDQQEKQNKLDEPYMVRVVYTSINANAHDGASEEIMGDFGTFILREGKGLMFREGVGPKLGWAGEAETEQVAGKSAIVVTSGATHDLSNRPQEDPGEPIVEKPARKMVEQLEFESFFECIRTGRKPDCDVVMGLQATICALLANRSAEEKRRIEIDPSLYNV
jgi:predicted dehydrogenase